MVPRRKELAHRLVGQMDAEEPHAALVEGGAVLAQAPVRDGEGHADVGVVAAHLVGERLPVRRPVVAQLELDAHHLAAADADDVGDAAVEGHLEEDVVPLRLEEGDDGRRKLGLQARDDHRSRVGADPLEGGAGGAPEAPHRGARSTTIHVSSNSAAALP